MFLQNNLGNIDAIQYLFSAPLWITTGNYLNFTDARPGTPLTASCVNISGDWLNYTTLNLGQYVSLLSLYLSYTNTLTLFTLRFLLFISAAQMLCNRAFSMETTGGIRQYFQPLCLLIMRPNSRVHLIFCHRGVYLIRWTYTTYPCQEP